MIMGLCFMRRMIVVMGIMLTHVIMVMKMNCSAVGMFMFVLMEMFMHVSMTMIVRMLHLPVTVFMHMRVIMFMCVKMLVFMCSVHFKISFRRVSALHGHIINDSIMPGYRICQGVSA